MSQVTFDSLQWGQLLWVVLAVLVIGVYGLWRRSQALQTFASAGLLGRLTPGVRPVRSVVRLLLVGAALAALVFAIIGPRWGEAKQEVVRRNVDVMVLLDVSRSMLARDIAPNRLERAKLAIREDLLSAMGGDRVGLITFAGMPSVKCPLTDDYGFLKLALEDVSTASSPRGGTAIGDAIRAAADAFDSPVDTHKLVILITDGEDHESYPVEAAAALWEDQRIPILALALGDAREGSRIPLNDAGTQFLQHDDRTVWSKADFTQLERVADATKIGVCIPVGTRDFDLGEFYRRFVSKLDVEMRSEEEQTRMPSRYYPFAVTAFALLLLESLIGDGPRFSKAMGLSRNGNGGRR